MSSTTTRVRLRETASISAEFPFFLLWKSTSAFRDINSVTTSLLPPFTAFVRAVSPACVTDVYCSLKFEKETPKSIEKQRAETFSVTCKYIIMCKRGREKEKSCTPNSGIVSSILWAAPWRRCATVPAILSHYQQMHQMCSHLEHRHKVFVLSRHYQLTKFTRLVIRQRDSQMKFMRCCYILSIYKGSAIAGKALFRQFYESKE